MPSIRDNERLFFQSVHSWKTYRLPQADADSIAIAKFLERARKTKNWFVLYWLKESLSRPPSPALKHEEHSGVTTHRGKSGGRTCGIWLKTMMSDLGISSRRHTRGNTYQQEQSRQTQHRVFELVRKRNLPIGFVGLMRTRYNGGTGSRRNRWNFQVWQDGMSGISITERMFSQKGLLRDQRKLP